MIHDWHSEWMTDESRALVDGGHAGVDCPECGASIMIPKHIVTGVAPDTFKRAKRSRRKAEEWAKWATGSLEDYLKTEPGAQYANYVFEP
jgi:hypothetical protein